MTKNQQLRAFYQKKFYNYDTNESFSSPYLISLDVDNINTDIMVVGQETNSWYYDWDLFKMIEVCGQMNIYKNYYNEYHKHKVPFTHHFYSKTKEIINSDNIVPVFNNLFKFDLGDGSENRNISKAPKEKLSQIIDFHKDILAKEIEIINPKMIIFFTGPEYDKIFMDPLILKEGNYTRLYEKIDTLSVDEWKCCRLNIQKFNGFKNFKGVAFRTYHPSYLNRNLNTFGQEIIDFLKDEVHKFLKIN